MNLRNRVELHHLLTCWIAEYGCDEMAARLVADIEAASRPTCVKIETDTASRHVREMSDWAAMTDKGNR